MPTSSRPRRPERSVTTRRQALAAGGGAVLLLTSGCGLRLESDPPAPLSPAPPTVDELARERTATRAALLLDLIAGVRKSRPDAGRALTAIEADHRAHLAALSPVSAAPTSTPPAATPAASLPRLLSAERSAAAAALSDVAATGATTARLLASVAASLQVHVVVLHALSSAAP